jgi:hypothetical protein
VRRCPQIVEITQLSRWIASCFNPSWRHCPPEGANMLITVAIILVLLWVLGFATSYTMGGLIHVLLIIAAVAIIARVIQSRQLDNPQP